MSLGAVLLLLSAAPAVGVFRGSGAAKMQPEVVSKLLSDVEKKWTQSRVMVLRNVTDDETSYASMEASCLKVSSAVVVGSEGDKDRVVEYMQDVCSAAPAKDAPTATMCTDFASGIEKTMTDDESWNRDSLDLKPFCKKFWVNTVSAAAQAVKQQLDEEEAKKEAEKEAEEKAREEEAQKKKEEEAKRAEEEAAAKKAADEQAAQEAARAKAYEAEQQKNITKADVNANVTQPTEATEAVEPVVAAPQVNASAPVEAEATSVTEAKNTSTPVEAETSTVVDPKNATESKNVTEASTPPSSNVTDTAVPVKK